ncbi:MAG: 7-carboxy-7-deazaguanine synthase [Alphaproteobacteria bacterium]|nr:7-carboxy-7-deazaguanine synthase [Alphaproteobacteria bacterium]MDE2630414.1 7-carboxy-7-deazaguanine synthase [Alphaproteobacteria bacterium]
MTYQVKEIYYTLQGEGARSGRASVFLRFAGCNLWSGLERDRASAVCRFCDTDFVGTDGIGGGKFSDAETVARAVAERWPSNGVAQPYVICTGGEPLLQLDDALIAALHARGFEIGIETNGTLRAPAGIEWICVSPKVNAELVLTSGQELKLVYPQEGVPPERYAALIFDHFFLQPMDGPEREAHTRAATDYCLAHPQWRLSLQTHKLIGIR